MFHGEDGRRRDFQVDPLPLPRWHQPLATAMADRVGPAGGRRTKSSAESLWSIVSRFIRFLATLPNPPQDPSELTVSHLEQFHRRRQASSLALGSNEIGQIRVFLRTQNFDGVLSGEVHDYVYRRAPNSPTSAPKPGYSDGELTRIERAARTDVARIRDRIQTGSHTLSSSQKRLAEQLLQIDETGCIPTLSGHVNDIRPRRRDLAQQMFVCQSDLLPLMVLLAILTGRNLETIKELPAAHRVLENRAVELTLIKRRRGRKHGRETVTWEIGAPGRELHTPGGLYLLIHRLMAPGRALQRESERVWSVWRNGHQIHVLGTVDEHHDPFAKGLNHTGLYNNRWVAQHGLVLVSDPAIPAVPLPLDFNRLKTSIEVRHTRRMGGHLPSAARTNSLPVLFANYLRGDPTVIDWAESIMSEALSDAEESAFAAHRQTLERSGNGLRVVAGQARLQQLEAAGLAPQTAQESVNGQLDTTWTECVDHDHHPATGKPCRASFLDCFHCGNCLITRKDLPRILALLDALSIRRQQLSERDWWQRYGPVWAAIRRDVLVKFTPTEIDQAAGDKPADALLDLLEHPWQRP